MVDRFSIVIYHSCFLTLSSHLLSWKLSNSFLAPEISPLLRTPFFPLIFKVEYSIQSSCRLFFRFPYECFLIPRLQAFVSIYQPSSHISRNRPPSPLPPLPAISTENVFHFLLCAASVRPRFYCLGIAGAAWGREGWDLGEGGAGKLGIYHQVRQIQIFKILIL